MNDSINDITTKLSNVSLVDENENTKVERTEQETKKGPVNNIRRPKHKSSDNRLNNRVNSEMDYIPTAVVIKNIPFSIKRELLLDIFNHLGLPIPFALNYHLDNGIFRGLAFANFRTSEETAIVIKAIRGVELCGRKLKIEYKKANGSERRESRSSDINNGPKSEESKERNKNESYELDFNDEQTRAFYQQISSFYEDDARAALIYPPVLNSEQRKIVHLVAEGFGLYHFSQGVGEERHIRVSKTKSSPSNIANVDKKPAPRRSTNFKGNNYKDSYDKGSSPNSPPEKSSNGPKPYKGSSKVYDAKIAYPIRQPTLPDLKNNFASRKKDFIEKSDQDGTEAIKI